MARDAYIWGATALIGGAAGALDAHAYAEIQDGDPCITPVKGDKVYHHIFDSSSSAAESSPEAGAFVIAPDDVGENPGRWILVGGGEVTTSVEDEAGITLNTGKTGRGWAMAGDNEEYINFRFTAAGVVTIISNSANAINTDTDGFLCVYDAGAGIAIKNRLGATKIIRYVVQYS